MIVNHILCALALLSVVLLLWQWLVAYRFPLHERRTPELGAGSLPAITLLKPLKGANEHTEMCLRSWLRQDYGGPVQALFGVAAADDPVCDVVRKLLAEHPNTDAQLVVCPNPSGANAKVSTLIQLERRAKHELVCISDADVRAPADLLTEAFPLLSSKAAQPVAAALVHCFYRLANPSTMAMQWEAIAVNSDFWSQVLQSRSLKPMDFALGAVMLTRRTEVANIGGFEAIQDCLADDYQLGNHIAKRGGRIALCPAVVECWDAPMGWRTVWKHQVRWARTIRASQPIPYFFSVLSNPTLWPAAWAAAAGSVTSLCILGLALTLRLAAATDLQARLQGGGRERMSGEEGIAAKTGKDRSLCWLAPVKDLLQVAVWAAAFTGNSVDWGGRRMKLLADGRLVRK